jgi:DNA polymerase-1
MWSEVLATYEKKGLTYEDALIQARIARILRGDEYNLDTGEMNLWTPEDAET